MAGKPIHQLRDKADIMVEVLSRARKIESASIASLSNAAGVNPATLNSALINGRLSVQIESQLCALCEFDPGQPTWHSHIRDHSLRPGSERADSARNFRQFLTDRWAARTRPAPARTDWEGDDRTVAAYSDLPDYVDDTLLTHRLDLFHAEDGQSGTCELHFQSDFGYRHHNPTGIRYGIRKAWLELRLAGPRVRGRASLGLDEAYPLPKAWLKARGNDRHLAWEVWSAEGNDQPLQGQYRIKNPALTRLVNCDLSLSLSSKIRVHTLEGFVLLDRAATKADEPQLPLEAAGDTRSALIEIAFAEDFPEDRQNDGWVILSGHDLTFAVEED
jgi:hypothetical protein